MLHVEVFLLTSLITRFLLSKPCRETSESVSKTARNVYSVRATAAPLIRLSTSKVTKMTNVKTVKLPFISQLYSLSGAVRSSRAPIRTADSGPAIRSANQIPERNPCQDRRRSNQNRMVPGLPGTSNHTIIRVQKNASQCSNEHI